MPSAYSVDTYLKATMGPKFNHRKINVSIIDCAPDENGYLCLMLVTMQTSDSLNLSEHEWKLTQTTNGWVANPVK